jgi:hypothetical protein
MVRVTGSKDCGNSPKNQFTQEVAVALEAGQIAAEMLDDEIVWHGLSTNTLEGISAVQQFLAKRAKPVSIFVEHAISHGRVGMANGEVTLKDGTRRRFSHVFDFTNAKGNCVATINSYE